MAAGFRSPAFWLGLAAAPVAASNGSVRGLLAPWIGGASAPAAAPTQAGVRSLLAPWIGGAFGYAETPVPPTPIPDDGYVVSGGTVLGWAHEHPDARKEKTLDDDKEAVELTAVLAYCVNVWQRNV